MADEKVETIATNDKVMLIHFSQAQAILNYLANRPYGEVYQFVAWLLELKEVAPQVPVAEK